MQIPAGTGKRGFAGSSYQSQFRFVQSVYESNRSYYAYAIFHSIRAVNILDGFDASKHSSVIAHFNWHYVHTGEFDREIYRLLMEPIALEKNAIIVISFWL